MSVYLPIAGFSINIFVLLGLGGGVGFLSGMFGVGGGFLLSPLLIFLGIPSAVAVASGANQVIGTSISGVIAHWRKRNVDCRMGMVLVVGGWIGSSLGVWIFAWLQKRGDIDLIISLFYVFFLGFIGGTMLIESVGTLIRGKRSAIPHKRHSHHWRNLPFKMRFPRSGLYISALLPLSIGMLGGVLSAIMGVGGGFIMVPAMIYLLEMPTAVVIGTSLFQIIFITANVTFLQAVQTQSVDVVLMFILLIGGVVGSQIGARFASRLRGEQLRALLAILVLGVCLKLFLDLVQTPQDFFFLQSTSSNASNS